MKILIISSSNDTSTENVMDWINYYGHEAIRYNVDSDFNHENICTTHLFGNSINEGKLILEGKEYDINSINSIWIRKFFKPKFDRTLKEELKEEYEIDEILGHLKKEFFSGIFALFYLWGLNHNILGGRITNQPTKIEMLIGAEKFGINIPSTLITDQKKQLEEFIKKYQKIITKPLKDVNLLVKNGKEKKRYGFMYTELLTQESLPKISSSFYISQFQEYLEKDIEIRAFYLDGQVYASAIFSQLDEQTNVDFRMYNNEKGNRTVPYEIPNKLILKIKNLMRYLNLNTGSIDLIKTKDGTYYFLEINPWGQYDMVSRPCNYNIDKLIAKYLIKNGK